MKDSEIVRLALIQEAIQKPVGDDEPYLVIGWDVYTKSQVIEMLRKKDKRLKMHLKTALKLFKRKKEYRLKFMKLAGIEK